MCKKREKDQPKIPANKYTLNCEPKALTGGKSEGIKSRGVAAAFIRGFIPS